MDPRQAYYDQTKYRILGRDPFNQNCNRSDREKWSTSKGGPVFTKLFRLDRTDPLSFGPKFPEILVEWIAPYIFFYSQTFAPHGYLFAPTVKMMFEVCRSRALDKTKLFLLAFLACYWFGIS